MLVPPRLRRLMFCALALLGATGCVDLTFDGGQRVFDKHIMTDAPSAPQVRGGTGRLESRDEYLGALESKVEEHMGYSANVFGNAAGRAKGTLTRVSTGGDVDVEPFSSMTEFGSLPARPLIDAVAELCSSDGGDLISRVVSLQDDTCTRVFSMQRTLRSTEDYVERLVLSFGDVEFLWQAPDALLDRCPSEDFEDGLTDIPCNSVADCQDALIGADGEPSESADECRSGRCAFSIACSVSNDCLRREATVKRDDDGEEVDLCEAGQCTSVRRRTCDERWGPPVLTARVSMNVGETQPGIQQVLADLEWDSLVTDFRIRPTPCDDVSGFGPNCSVDPGPVFTTDPAGQVNASSLVLPPLDIKVRGAHVYDNLRAVPHPVGVASCTALSTNVFTVAAGVLCFGGITAAVVVANNNIEGAADSISSGLGSLMNTLAQPTRLEVRVRDLGVNAATLQNVCNNNANGGPFGALCTAVPNAQRQDLFQAMTELRINLGVAKAVIGSDSDESTLGGDQGAWTANTIRAIEEGATLTEVTVDPTPIANLCANAANRCNNGNNNPAGCLFCAAFNPLCNVAAPPPACAQVTTPVALNVANLLGAAGSRVTIEPRPLLSAVAQLIPVFGVGLREVFTGAIPGSGFYTDGYMCGDTGRHPRCDADEQGAILFYERDSDDDGVPDRLDNCPNVDNAAQGDSDNDGIGDVCDLCPSTGGSGGDADRDGIGDLCDCDRDGDSCNNAGVDANNNPCVQNGAVFDQNPDVPSGLTCGGGFALADCSNDDDGDGILENNGLRCTTGQTDCSDNCPCTWNPDQRDSDPPGLFLCGNNRVRRGDACEVPGSRFNDPDFVNILCNWPDVEALDDRVIDLPIVGLRPEVCSRFALGALDIDPVWQPLNPGGCGGPAYGIGEPLCIHPDPRVCPNQPRTSPAVISFADPGAVARWGITPDMFGYEAPFGPAYGTTRDLDYDGYRELVATVPTADVCRSGVCAAGAGEVFAVSSSFPDRLWTVSSFEQGAGFGTSVASCNDGVFYTSAPLARNSLGDPTGAVYAVDVTGLEPRIVRTFEGSESGERFGQNLDVLCLQGRTAAIFAAAPYASTVAQGAGRVYGLLPDGERFATYDGTVTNGNLGRSLAVVPPNPSREEFGALLAGMTGADMAGGVASFHLDGSPRGMISGAEYLGELGASMRVLDMDADGRAEVAIGEPGASGGDGRIRIVTAGLGSVTTMEGFPGSRLGSRISVPGDLDGDGAPELTADIAGFPEYGAYVTVKARNTAVPPDAPEPDSPWLVFRGDPAHTAQSSEEGPSSPQVGWSTPLGTSVLSSPVVTADETTIVIVDGHLVAVEADGTVRWSRPGYTLLPSSAALSQDGTVYAAGLLGGVSAVDADSGDVLWQYGGLGQLADSPTVGDDGAIYFGDVLGNVTALEPDGALRWRFTAFGAVFSTPAIGDDGSVYFATVLGGVHALNADGSLRWTRPLGLPGAVLSSPTVGPNGLLYIGSLAGRLYALNSATGATHWTFHAGEISSPALSDAGVLYVGALSGRVYALDAANGAQHWQVQTAGPVLSSPSIDASGQVIVGSGDHNVYAFDPSGELNWQVETGGAVDSSPAIVGGGRVLIGSGDGRLYSLSD